MFLNGRRSLRYAARVSEILDLQGPPTDPDVEVVPTYLQNLPEECFKLPLVAAFTKGMILNGGAGATESWGHREVCCGPHTVLI